MKHFIKLLLVVVLIFSLSITAYAGGVEDDTTVENPLQSWIDEGYPVVSKIYDASDCYYARIATDQMGKFISLFVKGENISADTVKPIVFDKDGNIISGNVAACETITSGFYKGAFFRVEKLESPEWTIENTESVNSKTFTVKLAATTEKAVKYENAEYYSEDVKIIRRDVYYSSFDSRKETFTIYFSSDIQVDANVMPELTLGYSALNEETGEYGIKPVKTATAVEVKKETNKFTGQQETKAVFSLKGFDYENSFDNWTPLFSVTFKNSATDATETYSLYDDYDAIQVVGRSQLFSQTSEKATVKGNKDVILYYSYWIGGVYKFADTGTDSSYFISETEAEYLANERFAYAEYPQGSTNIENSSFKDREYNFSYFISKTIEKPKAPSVSVRFEGDEAVLSWNKIAGADRYFIYAEGDYGWTELAETEELSFTFSKEYAQELGMMLGSFKVKVCGCTVVDGTVVKGEWSELVSLEETVVTPSLNATKKTLSAGKTFNLTVENADGKAVTYKSDKTSVASVNKKTGVITALSKGTAKITATVNGEKLTCTIKVKNSPQLKNGKKTVANNKTISVNKGKTLTLKISGKASAVNNKVTTSKKAVAKITSKAKDNFVKIKAVKKGTSTVTIKINNAVTYTFKVKVK